MDLTISVWFLPVLGSALGLGFYDLCKKHAVRENSVMPVLFFASRSAAIRAAACSLPIWDFSGEEVRSWGNSQMQEHWWDTPVQ